jgi:predicted transcriptional regulator of viral defense system
MKILSLTGIEKLYFSPIDIAQTLGISGNSALVTCCRYVKNGFLIRLKRNSYILRQKWDYITKEELFKIANMLQSPSYISLSTSLSHNSMSNKNHGDFIESISLKRTKSIKIEGIVFNYLKIKQDYYSPSQEEESCRIASPEKSLLDILYLKYLGKYSIDISSIDLAKLDKKLLTELASLYPEKIRKYFEKYTYSHIL